MGVGRTGDRLDPLDRRGHDRAVAAPASRARGAGSAPDAGTGSVGGTPRRGPLRSLPRRRGAPDHRTAPDLRPRRYAADRHRRQRMSTATTGRGGFAALDACVHCGFCLQACPTFLATGDEADGPRGRIELMRAMERGDLSADDPSLILHLDRSLPCPGWGAGCPSAAGYGAALRRLSAALLFRGCVMDGLFSHVHEATIRTLTVNGYDVSEVPGQGCCGALHAHAGLHAAAQEMARINVAAFPGDAAIVVNSAGCGAMLKDYGRLLPEDPAAARFAARVRDVTELLAERGPRQEIGTPA